MDQTIEDKKLRITEICKEDNVKSLFFFVSVVDTGKYRKDSDIDILVSCNDNISMEKYTDSYFRLLFSLEELLEREIDLTTERSVKNPYFKEELEKTKVLFYNALSEIDG